ALHLASLYRYNNIAKTLIDHGATVNVNNNWGDTPLDIAKHSWTLSSMKTYNILKNYKGNDSSFSNSLTIKLWYKIEKFFKKPDKKLIESKTDVNI
ncbi:MAG: hypothetical protein OXC37_01760, partial [Bdellovibrionaceae bacterium]|nr:hypothetical protein [Pseudobdellovibrionaceae bacterium]